MGPAVQSSVEPHGSGLAHPHHVAKASGAARMARWKQEAVKRAIMRTVIAAGRRGATVAELIEAAPQHLSESDLAKLGALSLHVAAVQQSLEASGELLRLEGSEPARLVRASADVAA